MFAMFVFHSILALFSVPFGVWWPVIIVIIMHIHTHALSLFGMAVAALLLCFFALLCFSFAFDRHIHCAVRAAIKYSILLRRNYCCFIHSLAFGYISGNWFRSHIVDLTIWKATLLPSRLAMSLLLLVQVFCLLFFIHFVCCVYFFSSSLISFFFCFVFIFICRFSY